MKHSQLPIDAFLTQKAKRNITSDTGHNNEKGGHPPFCTASLTVRTDHTTGAVRETYIRKMVNEIFDKTYTLQASSKSSSEDDMKVAKGSSLAFPTNLSRHQLTNRQKYHALKYQDVASKRFRINRMRRGIVRR
jgi:hypothetical protein